MQEISRFSYEVAVAVGKSVVPIIIFVRLKPFDLSKS